MKLTRLYSLNFIKIIGSHCSCRCSFCKEGVHCGSKENGCFH